MDSFEVNGIRVHNVPNSSDMAFFGVAVTAGSNYDTPGQDGIAHFCEHMFYKGTKKRNWRQINKDLAMLGADYNAYTSRPNVLYYVALPKENISNAIEFMMDIFFNSTFPADEVEKERDVILEEIKMYEDDPTAAFSNATSEALFVWDKGHYQAGKAEIVSKFNRDNIVNFLDAKYTSKNILFLCCGDIQTDFLRKCIENNIPAEHQYFEDEEKNEISLDLFSSLAKRPGNIKFIMEKEGVTQSIVSCFYPGLSAFDNCYFDSILAQKAIGGGVYSDLWTRIREELGLCYSTAISTLTNGYPHRTAIELYGFTSPENVDQFMEESTKVIQNAMKNGINKDIFECAKIDLISTILRSTETSMGKASYIFRKHLFGKSSEVSEDVEKIRNIKIETCNQLVQKLFSVEPVWALLKPKGE